MQTTGTLELFLEQWISTEHSFVILPLEITELLLQLVPDGWNLEAFYELVPLVIFLLPI